MANLQRWKFEHLAKEFESLMRDLNDCQDAERQRELLLRMKTVIEQVDELMKIVMDQVDEVILREPATLVLPQDPDASPRK
jgi:hypothetical protein